MERLTFITQYGNTVDSNTIDGMYNTNNFNGYTGKAIDKLAAYENTGLTPEEIQADIRVFTDMWQEKIKEIKEERDYWEREVKKWCDKGFKEKTEEEFMIEEELEILREKVKEQENTIKDLEASNQRKQARINSLESDASWSKYPDMMGK